MREIISIIICTSSTGAGDLPTSESWRPVSSAGVTVFVGEELWWSFGDGCTAGARVTCVNKCYYNLKTMKNNVKCAIPLLNIIMMHEQKFIIDHFLQIPLSLWDYKHLNKKKINKLDFVLNIRSLYGMKYKLK